MSENIKILVVDDNQINRQYFSMALNKFGFSVTLAKNGFEAVEAAKVFKFDMIFMDIRMPEMDGYEAATKIRNFPHHQLTPILAISAENMTDDNCHLFNSFILKPVSPTQLKISIEKFCLRDIEVLEIFDKERALKYAYNDKEIMHKLIEMFLIELPEQMNLLEQSIKLSNTSECRNIIHKLRGSCKTCGAMVLDKNLDKLSQFINQNTHINAALERTKDSIYDFVNKFS